MERLDVGVLRGLRITVVIEDYAGFEQRLLGQHGVAFWVQARGERASATILVDTGQTAEPVLANMARLGLDPRAVDTVFLSHSHYDHTGGIIGLLEAVDRSGIPVVAHPDIFRCQFATRPRLRLVGVPSDTGEAAVRRAGGELLLVRDPLRLMDGVVSTGEIRDKVDFEANSTLTGVITVNDGCAAPDRLQDDMSLVFVLRDGLVVLTGCAHAGVVSIVRAAQRITGVEPVRAVIGGFHLINADEPRIRRTAEALEALGVQQVFPGHCTGLAAEAELLRTFGDRCHKLHAGKTIVF